MIRTACCTLAIALVGLTLEAPAANDRPHAEFAQKASWQLPAVDTVRHQVFQWLDGIDDEQAREQARGTAEQMWDAAGPDDKLPHLLDLVCATLALGDPQARDLVQHCSTARTQIALPNTLWLVDEKTPPIERANLRLLYGRWLVQESLYDEALEQLSGLQPEDVVDPAALLFYQGVVFHRTLDRKQGLAALERLMENEPKLPRRYASLTRLMQADLEGLKDESLDHIARRMEDIRRRLDLGRAGPKVRSVEDGVIASLDKLIDEMEKQAQAAAAAAAAAQQQQNGKQQQMPSNPLPDSKPLGGKGAGDVAKKSIGNKSGWGDLPPRERDEALQQIGKEFPAHYRDMIEQYFRRLATESEGEGDK